MNKTKIDWADMTWNPVTGCLHGCEYCYARKIATRFDGHFQPKIHYYRLNQPAEIKKPQTVFVCSMADLFGDWVPDEWISEVFGVCQEVPRHRYLFLTKNPKRYRILQSRGLLPHEHWYGTTLTATGGEYFSHSDYRTFISVEPLSTRVDIDKRPQQVLPDWVIVGAETGNRKNKVIPELSWIENILKTCVMANVPIFMKESLIPIVGDDMFRMFPWEAQQ